MSEVSEIVDVKKVVSDLKNNPVFRMSLASKELFHSNMLAWLLESKDIENHLPSEIAKELAKLFMPDYTVLTVLRERKHFDLLIVLFPTKGYDYTIKNSLTEIEDIFQNSGSGDKNLLDKLQKNCQFVVVENKFKSIPNKPQLDEYKNKAKITFGTKESKIEMTDKNITYYLLAPQVSLDHFEGCDGWETKISWDKISDTLSEAVKTKEKSDPFTGKFIEYYADFLKNMLELTKDIEKKLKSYDKNAFPNPDDIRELSKIRIHDFYEKLWFSVLLSKIEITNEDKMELLKGSGYTRSLGLLDFKITDAEKHVVRGVQIQNLQLRVILEPQIAIKKGDDRYTWQKTYAENDFNDYFQDIFKKIGEEPNGKLCKFGDFKYQYTPIDPKISIKDLSKKINNALDAIYHQSPSENLEGRKK
jgi:hypothetical protein